MTQLNTVSPRPAVAAIPAPAEPGDTHRSLVGPEVASLTLSAPAIPPIPCPYVHSVLFVLSPICAHLRNLWTIPFSYWLSAIRYFPVPPRLDGKHPIPDPRSVVSVPPPLCPLCHLPKVARRAPVNRAFRKKSIDTLAQKNLPYTSPHILIADQIREHFQQLSSSAPT